MKRIIGTITALAAVALVASMVFHRHEEPKITGKLSSRDVSEISKVVLEVEQEGIKEEMKACVRAFQIGSLVKKIKEYDSIKVASVETWPSNAVLAHLAPRTNRMDKVFYLVKNDTGWKCARPPWVLTTANPTTNTAPENR